MKNKTNFIDSSTSTINIIVDDVVGISTNKIVNNNNDDRSLLIPTDSSSSSTSSVSPTPSSSASSTLSMISSSESSLIKSTNNDERIVMIKNNDDLNNKIMKNASFNRPSQQSFDNYYKHWVNVNDNNVDDLKADDEDDFSVKNKQKNHVHMDAAASMVISPTTTTLTVIDNINNVNDDLNCNDLIILNQNNMANNDNKPRPPQPTILIAKKIFHLLPINQSISVIHSMNQNDRINIGFNNHNINNDQQQQQQQQQLIEQFKHLNSDSNNNNNNHHQQQLQNPKSLLSSSIDFDSLTNSYIQRQQQTINYKTNNLNNNSIKYQQQQQKQLKMMQNYDKNNNNIDYDNDNRLKNLPILTENFPKYNQDSNIDINGSDCSKKNVKKPIERGQYSGKLDFVFSCISYAVGLGNVWRFPYLCYENGGGAFLIPYLICIFLLGIPLFLMEVSLGQFYHAGGVAIWNQIPILKGVGYASMIMIGLCNTYYIVIIAWTLYYLINSFRAPLPWHHCQNEWNTEDCWEIEHKLDVDHMITPAQEFWNRKALNISGDLAEVGSIQWHLFGTLILAWVLVYIVIYKGIHQSGKIIWFMAMFPYLILTILFGYGITLPGAWNGISYYIKPQWHMLTEAKIWVAAGTQLLFTYGIGIGTNIALGSYNPTNHNFFRDSLIACLLSSFTSLFSGFVIFSVIGHMAFKMSKHISAVARSGPGLAFIVYPDAISRLPWPNLWGILFFGMLLILGIDSQFCTVESFVTGIIDEWPHLLRRHRKLFTLFVVFIHFLMGISMITSGGMYVFQLMDNFSASGITLLAVVFLEVFAFAWIYGADRIYENMIKMLNFRPPKILYYIWRYLSPSCLIGILIFSFIDHKPPEYAGKPFPWYGEMFGMIIASTSILIIPIYLIYYFIFKTDSKQSFLKRFKNSLKPIEINDMNGIESNVSKKTIDTQQTIIENIDNNNNNNKILSYQNNV